MDLRPNSDEGKVEALAAYGSADKDLLSLLKNATTIDKDSLSIRFDINQRAKMHRREQLTTP